MTDLAEIVSAELRQDIAQRKAELLRAERLLDEREEALRDAIESPERPPYEVHLECGCKARKDWVSDGYTQWKEWGFFRQCDEHLTAIEALV